MKDDESDFGQFPREDFTRNSREKHAREVRLTARAAMVMGMAVMKVK